jgi:hypothetical protein
MGEIQTRNRRGEWVPSIPFPLYTRRRCVCECGRRFRDAEAYRGHYALVHILHLGDTDG